MSDPTPPNFAPAKATYNQSEEQQFRNEVSRAIARCHQKRQHIDLGGSEPYVILTDTVTSARYSLTVASGVLTLTAL